MNIGYALKYACLVQKKMRKVRFNKENSNTKQTKSKRITFVASYHPLLKSFQSLINKHLNILYLDENAKEFFMPGPMVTFRSSRKLSSHLVRAKLYPLERVTGSCKCHGKCCAVCLNVKKTSTFTSSLTYETYQVSYFFINLQAMLETIRRSNYRRFPISMEQL